MECVQVSNIAKKVFIFVFLLDTLFLKFHRPQKFNIRAVGHFPTLEKETILGKEDGSLEAVQYFRITLKSWSTTDSHLWASLEAQSIEKKVRNEEDPRTFSDVVA